MSCETQNERTLRSSTSSSKQWSLCVQTRQDSVPALLLRNDCQTIGGRALLLRHPGTSGEEEQVPLHRQQDADNILRKGILSQALHGIKKWFRIGQELRSIPPLLSETKNAQNLTYHEDKLGFFFTAEERDFNLIAGLRYYTKQVTSSIIHAVYRNDKVCDLNPLSETLT